MQKQGLTKSETNVFPTAGETQRCFFGNLESLTKLYLDTQQQAYLDTQQ